MSENLELQTEEVEVLKSIYEGDAEYTAVSHAKHQYKFGVDGTSKSFILEICWGAEYPSELPNINLDAFYNKHIKEDVRKDIVEAAKAEAEQYLGMSMTYSLFEWAKENFEKLTEKQPESLETPVTDKLADLDLAEERQQQQESGKAGKKKEQLTKAQKRKMWDRGGEETERDRGWNWVDVVRHLSQTGRQDEG